VIAVGATSWRGLSTGTGTLVDFHTPDP
jgi:hypothetical protein